MGSPAARAPERAAPGGPVPTPSRACSGRSVTARIWAWPSLEPRYCGRLEQTGTGRSRHPLSSAGVATRVGLAEGDHDAALAGPEVEIDLGHAVRLLPG